VAAKQLVLREIVEHQQMPLSPAMRDTCLEIMDRLMKRPCARLFLEPVNPDRDGAPNYFTIVKHPVDLGTIRRRLAEDEYTSVAAWSRDMSLIWGNAEKFNGRDSILCSTAMQFRRTFEKEYRKLKTLSIQKWAQTVSELKDQLDDLFDSPPEPVANFATISEKPDPNQLKLFTEEEKDQFSRATMKVSSKQDAKKMVHIIRYSELHFFGPTENMQINIACTSRLCCAAIDGRQTSLSEVRI
jgi:hypothetical protein